VLVGAEGEGIVDVIRQFSPGFLQKRIFGEGDASLRIREILTGYQDARAG